MIHDAHITVPFCRDVPEIRVCFDFDRIGRVRDLNLSRRRKNANQIDSVRPNNRILDASLSKCRTAEYRNPHAIAQDWRTLEVQLPGHLLGVFALELVGSLIA